MDHQIGHRPSFAQLTLSLDAGETAFAQPGAMVAMSPGIEMQTETSGDGLLDTAKTMLGGESAFVNRFEAVEPGELRLAGALPGDIATYELTGDAVYAQSGAFVAAGDGVDLDAEWGGAGGFFSTGSTVLLKLSGTGTAFFSSYGAVEPLELDAGERHTVDTGHVVAFDDGVDYSTTRAGGGLKSTLFGGENLVSEFRGPGTVLVQTRDFEALVAEIGERLPNRGGGDV